MVLPECVDRLMQGIKAGRACIQVGRGEIAGRIFSEQGADRPRVPFTRVLRGVGGINLLGPSLMCKVGFLHEQFEPLLILLKLVELRCRLNEFILLLLDECLLVADVLLCPGEGVLEPLNVLLGLEEPLFGQSVLALRVSVDAYCGFPGFGIQGPLVIRAIALVHRHINAHLDDMVRAMVRVVPRVTENRAAGTLWNCVVIQIIII